MTNYLMVTHWDELYEVNDGNATWKTGQKKRIGPLPFVRLRVQGSQWSRSFREFLGLSGKYKAANFGVFCKMLEIAADLPSEHRGKVVNKRGKPLTIDDIGDAIGFPAKDIERALDVLTHPNLAWLKWVHPRNSRDSLGNPDQVSTDQVSTDQDKGEGKNAPTPTMIFEVWNKMAATCDARGCRAMSAGRKKHAKARIEDAGWVRDWQAAIHKVPTSPFLMGEKKSDTHEDWRPNIDWFLKPDTVLRIMEGSYADTKRERVRAATERERPKRDADAVFIEKCHIVCDGAFKRSAAIPAGQVGAAVHDGPEAIGNLLCNAGLGDDVVSKVLEQVKAVPPADGEGA